MPLFALPAWSRSDEEDSRIEMLASELRLLDSASSSSQPGRRKRKKRRRRRTRRTRARRWACSGMIRCKSARGRTDSLV